MIALLDVNVLLALVWSNHGHHNVAHAWFAQESSAGWATCFLTQSAFLRLSLNPHVVGASVTCKAALGLLASFTAHPHHQYIERLPSLADPAFDSLAAQISGYRQTPDAVLLYTARVHGMKLVTFDRAVTAINPWPQNLEVIGP